MPPLTRKRKLQEELNGGATNEVVKKAQKVVSKAKAKPRQATSQNRPYSHYQHFSKQQRSSIRKNELLALPAEIRNQIYAELIEVACAKPMVFQKVYPRHSGE
ncbi:hypothetical protein EJ08DRAFT_703029 [Tothia fuscella]|uniref:Uncharacterized protein n=1 Tax=Tothia fuscella TaxID=1048955 RepID=A0A9P4NF52_9PEZI|nr:hypothetical protein EJ08DRAFT_703029 [Tothia fuscella]